MKVFLLKDIEKVGMAGEIIKVTEGYGANFLIPRKLAVEITAGNEASFQKKIKLVEKRQEAIATQTSMLAEKIKNTKLSLSKKTHDDGRLYGSVNPTEIVELLGQKGISVAKNQIEFGKAIKSAGTFEVTIKLSSKLQPALKLQIVPE